MCCANKAELCCSRISRAKRLTGRDLRCCFIYLLLWLFTSVSDQSQQCRVRHSQPSRCFAFLPPAGRRAGHGPACGGPAALAAATHASQPRSAGLCCKGKVIVRSLHPPDRSSQPAGAARAAKVAVRWGGRVFRMWAGCSSTVLCCCFSLAVAGPTAPNWPRGEARSRLATGVLLVAALTDRISLAHAYHKEPGAQCQ